MSAQIINNLQDNQRCDREKRRQKILNAATSCFCHRGIQGASMRDISAAAEMSSGHIYYYFENKEAIVQAVVARIFDQELNRFTSFERDGGAWAGHIFPWVEPPSEPDLMAEILAEATRNASVAAIVARHRKSFADRLQQALRREIAPDAVEAEFDAVCALLIIVQDGVRVGLSIDPAFGSKIVHFVLPLVHDILRRLKRIAGG